MGKEEEFTTNVWFERDENEIQKNMKANNI